jgi:acyl carrier protein
MKERIALIISEITKVEVGELINEPSSFGMMNTAGWDSLAQLSIMTALEDEFEIEMSIEDMEMLNTAEKIFERFS